MAEPTLAQIFGANASQTSTDLVIKKADLLAVGLTASSTNSAESLVVSLLKLWQTYLTPTNLEANTEQQISIEDSYQQITTRGTTQYRQYSKTVNLQVVDASTDVDPDLF
ncbi:hypothetical protein NIES37_62650 [Tolypothrix tenuis PCC 7101]|uniref:Uncharacterized protein n=1 Tax=Tolypothrix tenuis PCC 7101 TaxID=231146 RepID=A0A1Z4N948_9CYAN|nr:hypothetical protein [Aulosira sp. FACHB-113]BAZ02253.1 hypothetical protein NIES37_62650 [Tolypothrix tenuis PCC 7101]BAZ73826.1 hypothetical protein NIES50_23920 [Aulosira laxa NIES-50]